MIYLLTAIGLTPGGSSTVHIYTQTMHRTTQKFKRERERERERTVQAVPRLCKLYPDICLTTEEKAWENLGIEKPQPVEVTGVKIPISAHKFYLTRVSHSISVSWSHVYTMYDWVKHQKAKGAHQC